MEVEFDEDEAFIRDQLITLERDYQTAFALLVAERLITSVGTYCPDYWESCAHDTVNAAWDCIEKIEGGVEKFKSNQAKLKAAEIGTHENPVITHIMKVIDNAIACQNGESDLESFLVELHHLMAVVAMTSRNPEHVDESVGGEEDYHLAACNLLVSIHASDRVLCQEEIVSQLQIPPTTLFG